MARTNGRRGIRTKPSPRTSRGPQHTSQDVSADETESDSSSDDFEEGSSASGSSDELEEGSSASRGDETEQANALLISSDDLNVGNGKSKRKTKTRLPTRQAIPLLENPRTRLFPGDNNAPAPTPEELREEEQRLDDLSNKADILRATLHAKVKDQIIRVVERFRLSIEKLHTEYKDKDFVCQKTNKKKKYLTEEHDLDFFLNTAGFYMVKNTSFSRSGTSWHYFLGLLRTQGDRLIDFDFSKQNPDDKAMLARFSKRASVEWNLLPDTEKDLIRAEAAKVAQGKEADSWEMERSLFYRATNKKMLKLTEKLEIMGFESLFMISDNLSNHKRQAFGTASGIAFHNDVLNKVDWGVAGFHNHNRNELSKRFIKLHQNALSAGVLPQLTKFVEAEAKKKQAGRKRPLGANDPAGNDPAGNDGSEGADDSSTPSAAKKPKCLDSTCDQARDRAKMLFNDQKLQLWVDAGFITRKGRVAPSKFPSESSMRASLLEKGMIWKLPANLNAYDIFWRAPKTLEESQFLLSLISNGCLELTKAPEAPGAPKAAPKNVRANKRRAVNAPNPAPDAATLPPPANKEVPVVFYYAGRPVEGVPASWPPLSADRLL
ncbi:hypothetical protein BJ508DRAFT_333073 [Ascobolus immersus RN42]|uniref:Uncharacterized protein n=1 Tax=Ascobolus immersus RN42 TaxID=1160509 RepID=A0A3N4HME7_ASCIM|nr:hypothetical protein BJ508DRAFT_333073 [Ascobolus immersus RN42]